MNRREIYSAVAQREQIKPSEAEKIINSFLEIVSLSVACGEKVGLRDFGKFELKNRAASKRRNPRTGDPVYVEASKTVRFTAAPKLKARVSD